MRTDLLATIGAKRSTRSGTCRLVRADMSSLPGHQCVGSLSAAVNAAAPLWASGRCLHLPMRPLLADPVS